MEEELVCAAQFDTSESAALAKMELDDAGIESFVENANISTAGLYFSMPRCEVKLMVRQTDFAKAQEILGQTQDFGDEFDELAEHAEQQPDDKSDSEQDQ